MPKLTNGRIPSYRLHKQSGQSIVTFNGKDHLLGPHDSTASREMYDRLIAEWIVAGRQAVSEKRNAPDRPTDTFTVAQLVAAFWRHAVVYYRDRDGRKREAENYRDALRPIVTLYGRTPAHEFGPLALKASREEMIKLGWARSHINRQILRVRSTFRWAVENELLPATVLHALEAVRGLRAGKNRAKESVPVRPVPDAFVDAVLPHVAPPVAAMIQLQHITGMRPGEACAMRGCDLDMSSDVWVYRPDAHKTAHHGHVRTINLGPRSQEIVRRFLKSDLQTFIFSPADGAQAQRRRKTMNRETPVNCGNSVGSNRLRRGLRRTPGNRYEVNAYRRAIARGCEIAFAMPAELRDPHKESKAAANDTPLARADRCAKRKAWRSAYVWHPHQLRHSAATRWRKEYGPDAALTLLGDRVTRMIDVYAAKDEARAREIMMQAG